MRAAGHTGRITVWGNTVGADTVASTGAGKAPRPRDLWRVPTQSTPAPGSYADTVTITF